MKIEREVDLLELQERVCFFASAWFISIKITHSKTVHA